MKCPAELYKPSVRIYRGLPEISYPLHDREILATACGRICLHHKKINFSIVFAGQTVGIKEVREVGSVPLAVLRLRMPSPSPAGGRSARCR